MITHYGEEQRLHYAMSLGQIVVALPVFLLLLFVVPSNWGKTLRPLIGRTVPARLAWMLFELPNLVWTVICFLSRDKMIFKSTNAVLLLMFFSHYVNRALVYPFLLSQETKPLPIETAGCAMLYTSINGYIQAQSLCRFRLYPDNYMTTIPFIGGITLYLIGLAINWQSDAILRSLRSPKAKTDSKHHYKIPYGGLFAFVSAPHYFGEILEWVGFSVACASLAAWSFAIFTCANLIPRAVTHHQWYKDNFEKYPEDRKALIPFIW